MTLLQQQSSPASSPKASLHLPFIDTSPLFDMRLAILLLPFWWVLGVEQFIWPIVFGFAAVKVLYFQRLRISATRPLIWFAFFLATVLISGIFIVEPIRYFTFVRNLGAFLAGFLALLVITNRANSLNSIDKLLNAVLIIMIIAGVAGLFGVLDIWRPSLFSLTGRLLPGTIAATDYGRVISYRELGQFGWFTGLGQFFRLSSFFLFSNYYSGAIIYVIPFLFMRIGRSRLLGKILIGSAIVLMIINLIYTTGRVAALSLLFGALYFVLFHSLFRRTMQLLFVSALVVAILTLLMITVVEVSSTGQEAGLIEQATTTLEAFVFARGPGSFLDRFGVYEATLQGFAERPFFGWGTERDIEGLDLPAGSHSEYLAALYRQGLIGVVALAGLLISVWRVTTPPRGETARTPAGTILRYGRWFYVSALINSIMNDPSVDTTSFVLLWVLLALLVATKRLIRHENEHTISSG